MRASVTVKVDLLPPKTTFARRGLGNMGRVQKTIDADCLRYNADYIRIRTGANIKSGTAATVIGSGEIKYTQPYAVYDYYPTKHSRGVGTAKGALRGDYHFMRMVAARRQEILNAAAKAAGGVPG